MPAYALICKFDDAVKTTLQKEGKQIFVSTHTFDHISNEHDITTVGTRAEIQDALFVHWDDTFEIESIDGKNITNRLPIKFGQKFTLSKGKKDSDSDIASVKDDDKAPKNGFLYTSYKNVEIHIWQRFGVDAWGRCHNKAIADNEKNTDFTYQSPLKIALWVGSPNKDTKDVDKFHIEFSEKFGQTVYYGADKTWSFVPPDAYSAGALLGMTKADGGYLISQVTSRNFSQPLTGKDGTRVKISGGVGFVVITGWVDATSFEAGIDVTVSGVSIGTLHGNLKEGIKLHVSLLLISGTVRFYLDKSPKELWVDVNLTVVGSVQPLSSSVKIHTFA